MNVGAYNLIIGLFCGMSFCGAFGYLNALHAADCASDKELYMWWKRRMRQWLIWLLTAATIALALYFVKPYIF